MKIHKLAECEEHAWYVLARDGDRTSSVIDTNEYLIVGRDEAILCDPGGTEIFPQVVSAVARITSLEKIRHFHCSHQDPDIFSSLPLWMGLCPHASIHMPWVWKTFIAHYGHEYVDRFHCLPDEGERLLLGRHELQFVPAHYLHSSGNFHLYDPTLKVYFSGDVGAALLPEGEQPLFVEDFDAHVQYMDGFHRRWMPSERARDAWLARVRKLDIEYFCPQHGSLFKGPDVKRFLDWFASLPLGSAIL